MFPSLKQLHCCFNSVDKLNQPSSIDNLTLLNLESNKVSSWDDVLHLSRLSRFVNYYNNLFNTPDLAIIKLSSCSIMLVFSKSSNKDTIYIGYSVLIGCLGIQRSCSGLTVIKFQVIFSSIYLMQYSD